jgi:Leucine-rich repeat (LRR) protein
MIKQEEENRKRELLLKSMNEVDYEFTEQDFDIALSKLIEMCHRFDQRQLGPAGWAAFTSMSLTPSEFREMAKRTFNLKVTPRELGALVTYFDVQMKGVVNCNSFMNTFVKIRVYCEPLKGTPKEGEELIKYHSQLKEEYKIRIQRQMSGEGIAKAKPWAQGGGQVKSVNKEVKERKKKPYPVDPLVKIKIRNQAAQATNRMDLSTRDVWSDDDEISHSARAIKKYHNPLRHEDHIHVDRSPSPTPNRMSYSPNNSQVSLASSHSKGSKGSKHGKITITKLLTEAKKHDDKRLDADYRLINVPVNIFRMSHLSELWMTNNAITSIPSDIADLKQLKIICFTNNELTTIAPEICLLPHLQRLYLRGNMIKELPELFIRMSKLVELDLSYNNIEKFPEVLCKLPSIISLDIAYNDLKELPDSMFNMRSLICLNVMHNLELVKYPVLSKMSWLMVHGLKQDKKPIPSGPKACNQFNITMDEEYELESLIKGRCVKKHKKRRNRN